MTTKPADLETLMRANAAALGLPIAAESWPGVLRFLTLAAGMAEQVMGLPLGVHDESGSVFMPVEPELGT
jgi:Protein of unknown function (DUF4089)